MAPRRTSSKNRIVEAAIWLTAQKGMQEATIRAIADRAEVTEGAVYRHFSSKQELLDSIYEEFVIRMAEAKRAIAESDRSFVEKLGEWVRITFEYYDTHPDAFTFSLLTPHRLGKDLYHRQGNTFLDIFRAASQSGQARDLDPTLALSHFTGIMMNIPRLINEETLPPPAAQYTAEVSRAVVQLLVPDAPTPVT